MDKAVVCILQGHLMAEPSVEHLRELMRDVMAHPDEAAAKGRAAREDMVRRFHPDRLATFLAAQFSRIASGLSLPAEPDPEL